MAQAEDSVQQQALTLSAKAILLVIFIHGYDASSVWRLSEDLNANASCRFKGTDTTFGGFPDRLQHVLTSTIENVKAETVLFPVYEASCAHHDRTFVID